MSADGNRTTTVAAYVVIITAAVVTASVVAPVVFDTVSGSGSDEGGESSVAVITFRGGTTSGNVAAVTESLREARTNGSVDAIVLRIDSPGGPVDASEEFYLAVNRTASQMPVVAYVEGTAASGGYFGIAPVDEIVVKPSSTVGSIGVIVQAPLSAVENIENQRQVFIRSGPDKAQITRDGLRENLELLQKAFVDTIIKHRGDELSLSRTEVATGQTFLGPRAVDNGFADQIGDLNVAIEEAAGRADGISGDGYNVYYKSSRAQQLNVVVLGEDESTSLGENTADTVYVDARPNADASTDDQFVQPVKYYAVWGVPQTTNQTVEVSANE